MTSLRESFFEFVRTAYPQGIGRKKRADQDFEKALPGSNRGIVFFVRFLIMKEEYFAEAPSRS